MLEEFTHPGILLIQGLPQFFMRRLLCFMHLSRRIFVSPPHSCNLHAKQSRPRLHLQEYLLPRRSETNPSYIHQHHIMTALCPNNKQVPRREHHALRQLCTSPCDPGYGTCARQNLKTSFVFCRNKDNKCLRHNFLFADEKRRVFELLLALCR